jgi:methyl-accepting chemotaxis protein
VSTNDRSQNEDAERPDAAAAPAAPPQTRRKRGKTPAAQAAKTNGDPSDKQLRALVEALKAVKQGDFSVRLLEDADGAMGEVAAAFNEVVAQNDRLSKEIYRISRVVGREGKMTERASIGHATGAWANTVEAVNSLIGDLVRPTTEVARVLSAVAEGDLTQTMALEIDGKPV